ncbi:hypothetical protein [Streptomyces hyaluromycini]|uniref:hypothetical protein n=1 Tax=Streptomyces hyaluromycini TaxID=1377993 RepID=UPI001237A0FB|nr:hypothetical protein [Streptomyces hyaluromycini]
MTSVRIWGPGVGAVVVLVATGVWARGSSAVDAGLWAEIRPAVEARLVAQSAGTGSGESEPALRSRWFCRAEALDLQESGGQVRAGINTLCEEYGEHAGALVLCGGAEIPEVVRLERDPADGGYRIVSEEQAPEDDGYGEWEETHFSHYAASRLDRGMTSTGLRTAARTHFGLSAEAPVRDC